MILSWQTGGHRPTSDLPIHPSTTLHQIFQLFQNPCSWRGMKSVEQIICMHLLDRIIPRYVGEINEIPPAAKQLFVLVARISDLLPKTHKFVLANGKKVQSARVSLYETIAAAVSFPYTQVFLGDVVLGRVRGLVDLTLIVYFKIFHDILIIPLGMELHGTPASAPWQ